MNISSRIQQLLREENGVLTFECGAPALMFICFLAILITLIIKTVRNRKEAKE